MPDIEALAHDLAAQIVHEHFSRPRSELTEPSQHADGPIRSDTESLSADYGVTLMPQLDAHVELSVPQYDYSPEGLHHRQAFERDKLRDQQREIL